jgi:hypothetical protein
MHKVNCHKTDMPVGPVTSNVLVSSYSIAKMLFQLLKENLQLDKEFIRTASRDFTAKLMTTL